MDDLFREILASPTLSSSVPPQASAAAFAAPLATLDYEEGVEGMDIGIAVGQGDDASAEQEAEVDAEQLQALWEWLPHGTEAGDLSALDLDIGAGVAGWDIPPIPHVSVAEVF